MPRRQVQSPQQPPAGSRGPGGGRKRNSRQRKTGPAGRSAAFSPDSGSDALPGDQPFPKAAALAWAAAPLKPANAVSHRPQSAGVAKRLSTASRQKSGIETLIAVAVGERAVFPATFILCGAAPLCKAASYLEQWESRGL